MYFLPSFNYLNINNDKMNLGIVMALVVDLYIFDTENVSFSSFKTNKYLTKEDINDASKYISDPDRITHAVSSYFKRKYIKDYYIDKSGKPLSNNTYFNISHSSNLVIMGIANDRTIGVDTERIVNIENGMIDFISKGIEKEYIKDNLNFFEVFTSKESLIKCIGNESLDNIKDIPSLPLDGVKSYKGLSFNSKLLKYKDYIISVTLNTNEDYKINIINDINGGIYGD